MIGSDLIRVTLSELIRLTLSLATELKWHQSVLENETARFHHRLLKLAVDLGLNVRIYQDVSVQGADAYDKSHNLRDPFAQLVRCLHLPSPSLPPSLSFARSLSLARMQMLIRCTCGDGGWLDGGACFRWRRADAGYMVWLLDGVKWRLGIGE